MKKKKCYTNRELSWLQFNERVLEEAGNPRVPLAERLTFASIFQSNLDEFFMVRVGTLMVQMHAKEEICENKTGLSSKEQVSKILKRTEELEKKKAKIYEQIMGELEPHGIRIINFNKLSNEEGKLLETYFDHQIMPFLAPMLIDKQQPFPFLNNKELYAVVTLKSKGGRKKIGIVPCTNSVFKRLIEIPTRPGTFMISEELILHFVAKLYPKYHVVEKSVMRLTRNADIDEVDVYDEDLDYRGIMEQLIQKRKRLSPVRLELSREIRKDAKKELCEYLDLKKEHVIQVKTPLDLSFVFQLQNYLKGKEGNSKLFYEKRTPRMSPAISKKESVMNQIAKKDLLLSFPYESMSPFLDMLHEAAEDESVVSIKMTLYRVAARSKIIDSLILAAENGKEVVVLVELRARFDEEHNIETSRKLEEAGCRILYGLGNYKVHSKLCQITRKQKDSIQYITQIGTGNYNEKTSELYTDLSLITADQELGREAAEIFQSLLLGETMEETKHFLVAPHCLQNKVLGMMDEEIEKAQAGQPAYIGAKINSLTDKTIIKKLIEASEAGVRIELIVRGICCLVPGVKDHTENVSVISIVGRFLEHSRIYRFGVGEEEKLYISSADFMTRNTLRRVEVAAPVYDKDLKKRIGDMFDLMMRDDEKGKQQDYKRNYKVREINEEKLNSQEYFYQQAYDAIDGK